MDQLNKEGATAVLNLVEAVGNWRAKRLKYNNEIEQDSEDDINTDNPALETLCQSGGSKEILSLTNFGTAEFLKIWDQ